MKPHSLIANHEAVTTRFGGWPDFTEAEVLRLLLDSTRVDEHGRRYASIELELRAWTLVRNAAGADGFDDGRSLLVHFIFERVYDVELEGLNHQNVLSSLEFALADDPEGTGPKGLSIELVDCFGLAGGFKARSAAVHSIRP